MKKSILVFFLSAFILVSCNQKNKLGEAEKSKIYACSMHPEIQGKLDDTCSKCGMKLTEEVK